MIVVVLLLNNTMDISILEKESINKNILNVLNNVYEKLY